MHTICVNWIKSQADHWLSFENFNLASVTAGTSGIYAMWKAGADNHVVYVGQGDVAERIACHRLEANITRHGPMLVTWASVDWQYLDGVERFLADKYSPLARISHSPLG